MQTSVILHRVADFLRKHAPFDALPEADLLALAGSGRVKFHQSEEYVFRQGDSTGSLVWVIQQGRVELIDESSGRERLCDVLGPGDLLGLDRFVDDGVSRYSHRTCNDVILYGVDAAVLESTVARNDSLQRFLAARVTVAGVVGNHRRSWLDAQAPPIEFLRARFKKREAASTSPLTLVHASAGTRDMVRAMLRDQTEHLGIGTPLEALVSADDLALFCGQNPIALLREIRRSDSTAEVIALLKLTARMVDAALAGAHDVDDCCRIEHEVMRALTEVCVRMATADVVASGLRPSAVASCWLTFGAAARRDLTQPALPTVAVIYDDCDAAWQALDSLYFVALAGRVADWLFACGLSGQGLNWPRGAQPSMPLSEWTRLYSETMLNPMDHDLYARRDFFDLAVLSGKSSILDSLENHIQHGMQDHATAIALLANDTLVHLPPLTFFAGLVLEIDGQQRETFDVGTAVIAPITNAARVFALAQRRLTPTNTLERLALAEQDYPDAAAVLREAAEAFRVGLYYQTLAGGDLVSPGTLGKLDHLLLKTAFASIERFLEFTLATFVPKT